MSRVEEITEQRDRRLALRRDNDIAKALSTPEGRRLVWAVLEMGRVFQLSFTGNSETYLNEGRRAVGLEMLGRVIAVKPEAFTQMTLEHYSEEKAFSEELEKARKEDESNG